MSTEVHMTGRAIPIGANPHRPSRYLLAAGFGAVSVVVAAATWNAARWNWGFVAFYVGLAFLLELTVRLRSSQAETTVQTLVLSGSAPFVLSWFFGEAWHNALAAVHVTAIATLGIMLGYVLGYRLRHGAARHAV
jgi:FtsH-binding integral membrane protein